MIGGIQFHIIPDTIWAVPDWKLQAFPALWHQHLGKQWLPNPACPDDGQFLINKLTGVGFCNARSFDQLKKAVKEREPMENPWKPQLMGSLWP